MPVPPAVAGNTLERLARPCPACEAVVGQVLRNMPYALFEDSTLPRLTRVVRCPDCGFVFADSDATAKDYLAHYQRNSIYAAADARGASQPSLDPLVERAGRFLPHVPEGGTLVDIGAGSGDLLDAVALCRPDIQRIAIDPDALCVQPLQARGILTHQGSLDCLPVELLGRADAVVLSHVLEHLWTPVAGLAQASALLRPGGVIYVETPDREGYAEHGNVPFYYFDPEHINHFAVADHVRIGARAGLGLAAQGRSVLWLQGGISYPACWAVLRYAQSDVAARHAGSAGDVERYIAQEEIRLRQWLTSARATLSAAGGEFVVWGTGSQAQRMLAEGLFEGMRIITFVDSDPSKQGRRLGGHAVLLPQEGLKMAQAPVVVLAAQAASTAILRDMASNHPGQQVVRLEMAG